MYLLTQIGAYLMFSFLLGAAAGYALWRVWGEREAIARYKAAELRLAEYIAQWEHAMQQGAAAPRGGAQIIRGPGAGEAVAVSDRDVVNRR